MSWLLVVRSEARAALGRLRATDPDGAKLLTAAIRDLAKDPTPAGVHVLSETEGLYRQYLSRIDKVTGTSMEYRIIYQVDTSPDTVTVILVGVLPPPRKRQ